MGLSVFQCPLHILQGTACLFPGTCHIPSGGVGDIVCSDEIQFCPGFAGVTPHQLPVVIDQYLFLFAGKCLGGIFVSFTCRTVHAGRVVIECQADGIEYGRFSGSRFPADEEQGLLAQWAVLKVDDGVFYGCQVFQGQFLKFH